VDTTTEVEAGDPAQYAAGSITRIAFGKKPVFLVARADGGFLALSAICTHLGCVISPKDDNSGFHCPCHGGVYDIEGTNTGGPPPKPLARYDTELREGVLWIVRADAKKEQA
jgi:cytochrome b6-f complex iron-sulfur subunit